VRLDARRIRNAWLVVRGGPNTIERIKVLNALDVTEAFR
jgi:hypothetical protein